MMCQFNRTEQLIINSVTFHPKKVKKDLLLKVAKANITLYKSMIYLQLVGDNLLHPKQEQTRYL